MLTYNEAIERILDLPLNLESERAPLLESGNRIVASPLAAPWPLPRFDNSSMDGFAVRASDLASATGSTPVSLPITGESAAGAPSEAPMKAGTAIRISTGARIPEGADAIVPVESVEECEGRAAFKEPAVPGRFIRRQGEDVSSGQQLCHAGDRLEPALLAYLGMFNLTTVDVWRRPRIALLSSGDEVRELGEDLRPTDVVGVNLYYLAEELTAFGCEVRSFGISPDDPGEYRRRFEAALAWGDTIVSTAGVSMGEHDVVGDVIRSCGGEIVFWKASVRPGKPILVARFGERSFFGLPGNPVSVCCNTEIFVKPFLRSKLGITPVLPVREEMVLEEDCPRDRQRLFFVYSVCRHADGAWRVRPLGHQSSGNLSTAAAANALIVLEPGVSPVPAGDRVSVQRIATGR